MYDPATTISVLAAVVLMILIGVFIWRIIKSSVKRTEYIDAYAITKLKQHASKQGLELESALKEINKTPFWNPKTKREKLNYKSDIAKIDYVFEELEKQEAKEKKAKK